MRLSRALCVGLLTCAPLVACTCQRPENVAAKKRLSAPPPKDPTAALAQEKLDAEGLHKSDEARDRLARAYTAAGVRARVETFLPGIGIAYRAASLALVRGGGATLAELLAAGVPGVCVPMPGSADDHQRKNADAFVAMGGVRWLEEQTLTTDHFRELVDLAQSPWQIEQHAQRARSAGRPNAAAVVARRLVNLSNPQHNAA